MTKSRIIQALQSTNGLLAFTAKALGVSQRKLASWIAKSNRLTQALTDAREFMTDVAEAKLYTAIHAGKAWAIKFYLQTKGAHRGYGKPAKATPHWLENATEAEVAEQERRLGSEPIPGLPIEWIPYANPTATLRRSTGAAPQPDPAEGPSDLTPETCNLTPTPPPEARVPVDGPEHP